MTVILKELQGVTVEHGLGMKTQAGFVKFRMQFDGAVGVAQLRVEDARQIAGDLLASAARAQYEQDLWNGLKKTGMVDELIAGVLASVRNGEIAREMASRTETKDADQ